MTMMTKVGTGTVRHPASDMGDILSGSGYLEWLRRMAKHELIAHDACQEAAAIVRRGIEKSGKRYLMGLDVKWTARRCTKPILFLAGLHWEAARACSLAIQLYQGAFADATVERAAAGEFDPKV